MEVNEMIIVGILKFLGCCALNLMLAGFIGFCPVFLFSMALASMRRDKPIPDSYYNGVALIMLLITAISLILLSIFGPFSIIG